MLLVRLSDQPLSRSTSPPHHQAMVTGSTPPQPASPKQHDGRRAKRCREDDMNDAIISYLECCSKKTRTKEKEEAEKLPELHYRLEITHT